MLHPALQLGKMRGSLIESDVRLVSDLSLEGGGVGQTEAILGEQGELLAGEGGGIILPE